MDCLPFVCHAHLCRSGGEEGRGKKYLLFPSIRAEGNKRRPHRGRGNDPPQKGRGAIPSLQGISETSSEICVLNTGIQDAQKMLLDEASKEGTNFVLSLAKAL